MCKIQVFFAGAEVPKKFFDFVNNKNLRLIGGEPINWGDDYVLTVTSDTDTKDFVESLLVSEGFTIYDRDEHLQ